MTPIKSFPLFWDAIIDRMQFSVVDESKEGGAALFVFVDKLLKLAKTEGLGQKHVSKLFQYAGSKLELQLMQPSGSFTLRDLILSAQLIE